jgi:hypothetical protein
MSEESSVKDSFDYVHTLATLNFPRSHDQRGILCELFRVFLVSTRSIGRLVESLEESLILRIEIVAGRIF